MDTRMKVVDCPAWNLDSSGYCSRVEIVQAVGPTGGPRIYKGSKHLKINVPALLEHLRGLISQMKPIREPIDCWDPCPELVHLTAEVHDGCRDLRPRHPRLVWGD